MPRDGSGIYTKPYPNVVSGTTIESAVHNGTVSDIETDLNAVRPIIAGGTGASNADQALVNVSGEKAAQVVTNYSSHLFFPGSFRSAAAATGAPNATAAFAGVAYINEALANPPTNANVVLEARDFTDGVLYVRRKTAGTWGAWETERQTIAAAPFNAMAYSGMQINGSIDVSQELGVSATTVNDTFICDGWRLNVAGAMAVTASQVNAVGYNPGLPNILSVATTSAAGSLGSGDLVCVRTKIEGYRTASLAWGGASTQSITIGFWTAHFRTGVWTGVIRNNASNRTIAFSYTQNVSSVFQYNIVTIPGDATGTWETTNLCSMDIAFTIAAGASLTAPAANTWYGTSYLAGPGQVNGVASTSDVFRLNGVVILPGTQAPTATQSPLIMRPYDQELVTCKRYYEDLEGAIGSGHAISTTAAYIVIRYLTKRATPTITHSNLTALALYNAGGAALAVTGNSGSYNIGPAGLLSIYTTGASLVAGNGTELVNNSNGRVLIDARL